MMLPKLANSIKNNLPEMAFLALLLRIYIATINLHYIPMKPYIKGQYWMIITILLCDNYFLVVIIQWEKFQRLTYISINRSVK